MTCILPGGLGQLFAGGTSGFSPTRNTGSVTLSNGNRTITGTSTKPCPCAGTRTYATAVNGPQLYFEMTFGTIDPYGDFSVGLVTSAWTPTDGNFIGATTPADSAGTNAQGPWTGGASTGFANPITWTGPTANNGDIIGVAASLGGTSGSQIQIWFRQGANWFNQGSPTTIFPAGGDIVASGGGLVLSLAASVGMSTATLNTGSSAFANAPPAGYVAWG